MCATGTEDIGQNPRYLRQEARDRTQNETCQHLKEYNICNASLINLKTEKGKNYSFLGHMLQLFVKNGIVKQKQNHYMVCIIDTPRVILSKPTHVREKFFIIISLIFIFSALVYGGDLHNFSAESIEDKSTYL